MTDTLNLKKPGKLNATAEYAKDFTFYIVKAQYEPSDLEGGTQPKADDIVFTKAGVPAQNAGPTARIGTVDLGPEAANLKAKLDDIEKKIGTPLKRLYSYCLATSEQGDRKMAAANPLTIDRPTLALTVVEPPKFQFNYKDATKNVVEVKYTATNEVKSVEQDVESTANFALDHAAPGAQTPDSFTGSFFFKATKPGITEVPIVATSLRDSVEPVTQTVILEAQCDPPDVQVTPAADSGRVGEPLSVTLAFKGCEQVEIKMDPADVFVPRQAVYTAPGTILLDGKKGGLATLTASGKVAGAVVTDATCQVQALEQKLEVSGDTAMLVGLQKALTVEFAALDRVDLTLDPAGIATLDKSQLPKSDVVRVTGVRDGKTTLTAFGRLGTATPKQQAVALTIAGPSLTIDKLSYRPPGQ